LISSKKGNTPTNTGLELQPELWPCMYAVDV